MSEFDSAALSVNDTLYLSDDLLHWKKRRAYNGETAPSRWSVRFTIRTRDATR